MAPSESAIYGAGGQDGFADKATLDTLDTILINDSAAFAGDPNVVKRIKGVDLVASIAAALPSTAAAARTVNTRIVTAYTLVAGDMNTDLRFTSNNPVIVTVPNTLATGFSCRVRQAGAGQVSFVGSGGMVIASVSGAIGTSGIESVVDLVVVATNKTVVAGNLLTSPPVYTPLSVGLGYAPVVLRFDSQDPTSLIFATGSTTEVSGWRDKSGSGLIAAAPNPAVGSNHNMQYVPNALNGRPALRARSMTAGGGTPLVPVLQGLLRSTTGFPTGSYTQHCLFALTETHVVPTSSFASNSLFTSSAATPGHLLYVRTTPQYIGIQATLLASGTGSANSTIDYIAKNNWMMVSISVDAVTRRQKVYYNGNLVHTIILPSYTPDATFAFGAHGSTYQFPADAYFGMCQAHAGVLTDEDVAKVCAGEFERWGIKPIYIAAQGDSIQSGRFAGDTSSSYIHTIAINSKVQRKLLAMLNPDGTRKYPSVNTTNNGISGKKIFELITDSTAVANAGATETLISGGVLTKFTNKAVRNQINFIIGTNDNSPPTAAPPTNGTIEMAYANLITLISMTKASGLYQDIAVWTCLPRCVLSPTYAFENLTPRMFQYNELIRTGMQSGGSLRQAGATHLIDVQNLAAFNNANAPITIGVAGDGTYGTAGNSPFTRALFTYNPNLTLPLSAFVSDCVHPSEASNELLADLYIQAMGY